MNHQKNKNQTVLWIFLMLMIITGFHYFTESRDWQLHDFFRRLYYIPIILAAFRYGLKGGFSISVLAVLVYAPHLLLYFGEINIEVVNQFLEALMFVVIGLITGYLVEQDQKARNRLEEEVIKVNNIEKYTKNILNSIDTAVIAFDRGGELRSVNRKVRELFPTNKLLGKYINEQLNMNKIKAVMELDRIPEPTTGYTAIADGSEVYLRKTVFPIKDVEQNVDGAVLVLQDLTKVKNLEDQVRRGERLSAVGELASGIAHEIRNPLGIIKTVTQSMDYDQLDEETQEGISVILEEVDRANLVVQGLLDFSKPGSLKFETLDLREVMNNLLLMTRKYGEKAGITIRLEKSDEPCLIHGDRDRLKQAFVNLIFNGIQAMTSGSEMILKVAKSEQGKIVVSVTDYGVGIPDDSLERIFNPFFTTKDTGSGLGLPITYRIIEEHRGELQIKSKVNKGTTVKVYFPESSQLKEGGIYSESPFNY